MAFPTNGVLNSLQGGSLSGNFTTPAIGQSTAIVTDSSGAFTTVSSTGATYWNPGMFGADQEVYITWATVNLLVQLELRVTNPGGTSSPNLNDYAVNVTASTWQLYRTVNNATTQINSGSYATLVAGDGVGLEAIGTTITLYTKRGAGAWTSVAATTDSVVTGAGYIGFLAQSNVTRVTNFGGGTVGAVAANSGFLPLL